jgi:hypothetical protein
MAPIQPPCERGLASPYGRTDPWSGVDGSGGRA